VIEQVEIDDINDELDPISDQLYDSWSDAWQQVALVLEAHGITVPSVDEFDDEMVFKLENDGQDCEYFLYVAKEDHPDEDKYTLYATLATQEDLDAIVDAESDDDPIETDV
jgi:hypothetical protein